MFEPVNEHPTSLALLAAGLVTFLGLVGVGKSLCQMLKLRVREPWQTVLAALSGMLVVSFVVEITAICCTTSPTVWAFAWWGIAGMGVWEGRNFLRRAPAIDWKQTVRDPFLLLAIMANAITLLIALAPSSKFDELYYHMLAPQRVLMDGGLKFYRFPWQSAILSQMHYQLLQVTLHAVDLADAANVVSWCNWVLLQFFVAGVITTSGSPRSWGVAAAACLSVGMLPAVWHVTAGAHAVGYLASAALILLAAPAGGLREAPALEGGPRILAAALLAVAAVSTKITLFPLEGVCLVWVVVSEWHATENSVKTQCRLVGMSLLPWALFFGPLAVFTARASGSPFAVVFAGSTGPGAYAAGEAVELLRTTRAVNQADFGEFIFKTAIDQSPVVWLAAVAILVFPFASPLRWFWAAVTSSVLVVILFFTHNDLRFAGGYPAAALALAASCTPPGLRDRISRQGRLAAGIALVSVVPWLGGMAFYARPFIRCSSGLQSREEFLRERTAFRNDFLTLHQLLPRSAVLLVTGGRLNSVNAPRPVLYDVRDLPTDRPIFVLAVNDSSPTVAGYDVGATVYENLNAVAVVYRRPGMPSRAGAIRVFPLEVSPPNAR